MIYLSDINSAIAQKYLSELSTNPFSTRVKSLLLAYGSYPNLLDFWYQTDNNITTAYIVRYGGEFIADILPQADVKELINFCKMSGGMVLMCKNIDYGDDSGIVMKLENLSNITTKIEATENISLDDCYEILLQNKSDTFPVPSYEDYYVDLNHRLRKNTAVVLGAFADNSLVSCCFATAVDSNSAVLSSVATLPRYKSQGYGTAVVTAMCKKLIDNGKNTIFLQRAINENYSFYNKIGFEDFSVFEQILLTQ